MYTIVNLATYRQFTNAAPVTLDSNNNNNKHGNVFKPGFVQIFSCCPKNLSCPKLAEDTPKE